MKSRKLLWRWQGHSCLIKNSYQINSCKFYVVYTYITIPDGAAVYQPIIFFPKKPTLQKQQKCLVCLCYITKIKPKQISGNIVFVRDFCSAQLKIKGWGCWFFWSTKGNVFQWDLNLIFFNLKMNGNILFRLLWIPHLLSLLKVKSSTLFNCCFLVSHFKTVVIFATLYTFFISSGSYWRWRIRTAYTIVDQHRRIGHTVAWQYLFYYVCYSFPNILFPLFVFMFCQPWA